MNVILRRTQSRQQRQRGFAFLQILAMLGMGAALLGVIGYGFVSLTRTGTVAASKSQASDALTQAKNAVVVSAADTDATPDNVYEAPAMLMTNCSTATPCPTLGGHLPLTIAPRTDAWGSLLGYCVWDNGITNTSTGRITGETGATNTGPVIAFAVVSAGPNKVFDSTCATIKTNFVANAANVGSGDDGVRAVSQAQMIQGVGGTVYFGDPVPDEAALAGVTASVTGTMRVVLDTRAVYVWNGSNWLPASPSSVYLVKSAGQNCDDFPQGSLARDSATGDLLICKN